LRISTFDAIGWIDDVDVRQRREVVLRVVLGELQRPDRSPRAGRRGTDQTHRQPCSIRGHQWHARRIGRAV